VTTSTDPSTTASPVGSDQRHGGWTRLVLLVVPVAAATVSVVAAWRFRVTVGDTAWLTQRVADVVAGRWPLVGMPSSVGRGAIATSHPGPVEFYWLAPWWWLAGFRGITLGSAASSVVALSWLGFAVRGLPRSSTGLAVGAQVAAVVGILTIGLESLADPWNPYLALPWAVLLLAGVAQLANHQRRGWVTASVAGSVVAQLHAGFLPWVALFVVVAVVIGVRHADARPDRKTGFAALTALVVLWLAPFIDLIGGSHNPWLLFRAAAKGGAVAGWRPVVVAAGSALRPIPTALDGPWLTSDPRSVEYLVVFVTALAGALTWWFARRDRPARIWIALSGTGLAAWLAAATRALPFGQFLPVAYTRLLWPLASVLWFWIAAAWWEHRPTWASRAWWIPAVVLVAWVASIPRGYVGIDPAIRIRGRQLVDALDSGMPRTGPQNVTARTWLGGLYLEPTVTAELDRRGIRSGVGANRQWDLAQMTTRPSPLAGARCETVLGDEPGGGSVVAPPRGLDAAQQRRLRQLRDQLVREHPVLRLSRAGKVERDSRFEHDARGEQARHLIDSGNLADLVVSGLVDGVTMRDPAVAEYVELAHLANPSWSDLTIQQTGC
jgi:hypothetical protein